MEEMKNDTKSKRKKNFMLKVIALSAYFRVTK